MLIWPPTKEMGGVLSLNFLPTPEEWQYCGFKFHILFGAGDSPYLDFIAATGATAIPYCNYGNYDRWSDESHVGGYFLADDTPYDPDKVKGWYDKMKQKTSKPVGTILWGPPNETDRLRLIRMSNFLDFLLPYAYPYIEGHSLERANNRIAYMISVVKALNCPVMMGAQGFGHLGGAERFVDPKEVGIRNQYRQYYDAGIPIWWYSWTNFEADIRRNHQGLMHEFYTGQEEIITDESIIHNCNRKIAYQVSSFVGNNSPLSCPYCGLVLGPEGIVGSTQIDEEVTTQVVTCPKCTSRLELTISSITSRNIQQYCPVCGEPAD